MNDVENEVEEQQAEDGLVNRVPKLKQLSKDIDKATNTFINATLELESAIRKYNSTQTALGNAVDTISGKVDTINKHIDNVLKESPTKLQVSVKVSDADWKRIQDMFDKQHQWMSSISVKSTKCLLMNAEGFSRGTRNMMVLISDTMSSGSSGSSSYWASSCSPLS